MDESTVPTIPSQILRGNKLVHRIKIAIRVSTIATIVSVTGAGLVIFISHASREETNEALPSLLLVLGLLFASVLLSIAALRPIKKILASEKDLEKSTEDKILDNEKHLNSTKRLMHLGIGSLILAVAIGITILLAHTAPNP